MKTSILVVEADALVRNNLVELLGEAGFDVITADNGADGVALAKARPPQLMICDSTLPKLDGAAVLRALRDEPATAGVPLVFLTKPFTPSELLEAVHTRLQQHEEVAPGAREPPAADPEPAARKAIRDALERTAGNQTRAAELLGISRRTLVTRLTEFDLPRPRKR